MLSRAVISLILGSLLLILSGGHLRQRAQAIGPTTHYQHAISSLYGVNPPSSAQVTAMQDLELVVRREAPRGI